MLTPVPAVPTAPPDLIAPAAVRYIKLGRGGAWEQECVATSTMRMGFGTEDPTLFRLCHRRDWAGPDHGVSHTRRDRRDGHPLRQ